jgi:predicted membrane protein (TIGR00267 family)
MFVVSPFFLAYSHIISAQNAFMGCIILTLILLTILGIYLAKISDESMIRYGIQMLVVGIITAFLCVMTSILLGGSVVI